jgi:hypothetical protein
MSAGHRRLDVEESGDVTIAKFVDKKILDEGNIQIIGNSFSISPMLSICRAPLSAS